MYDAVEQLRTMASRGGPIPSEYEEVATCFRRIAEALRSGGGALNGRELWRSLGDAFSSDRTLQGHVVARPHGYPGDFALIDKIYRRVISADPLLANWDRFFQAQAAPEAVRQRKNYFVELATRLLATEGAPLKILNVGCGPAREVSDVCSIRSGREISFSCIDHDDGAIRYAVDLNKQWLHLAEFQRCNLFRFRSSEKFDVIWVAGVFDYFTDKAFQAGLRKLVRFLAPFGRLIVANFAPDNPSRAYMESGGWFLNYRTQRELVALTVDIGVGADQIYTEQDGMGIVNFLHISPVSAGVEAVEKPPRKEHSQ